MRRAAGVGERPSLSLGNSLEDRRLLARPKERKISMNRGEQRGVSLQLQSLETVSSLEAREPYNWRRGDVCGAPENFASTLAVVDCHQWIAIES